MYSLSRRVSRPLVQWSWWMLSSQQGRKTHCTMNGMTTEILPAGRPRAHGASLEEPLRKAAASAAAGAEGSPGWSSDLGVG